MNDTVTLLRTPEADRLRRSKWDLRYLSQAFHVSTWSKDPSTQTGAFIADAKGRPVSFGMNGLPQRVQDTHERLHDRAVKYECIIHCEVNAHIFAGRSLDGCTLYTWPFVSCSRCASIMIQAGIVRHVAPEATEEQLSRWRDSFNLSMQLFAEANVEVVLYSPDEVLDSLVPMAEKVLGMQREKAKGFDRKGFEELRRMGQVTA
jgi:dCMP deaminase